MSENNKINSIMEVNMEKLRAMVDADTIIGTQVTVGDVTLVPVSKVSFGTACGGSDFPNKHSQDVFGGGGGAGVSITPVAFIAINGDNVKMLPIYNDMNSIDKAINMAPELIDKIKEFFTKKHNIDEE